MTFDPNRRFVRVLGERGNDFVEFEFAMGEPGMMAELVMPRAAFEAFCTAQQVEVITTPPQDPTEDEGAGSADADFHWSLHQATHQRFR